LHHSATLGFMRVLRCSCNVCVTNAKSYRLRVAQLCTSASSLTQPSQTIGRYDRPGSGSVFDYRVNQAFDTEARVSGYSLDLGTDSNPYAAPVSANPSANRPMYSGELARLAGVSGDTIRFYERSGLLPAAPRSASGYRIFPRHALHRVQVIRSALGIGFSVRELADVFRERDRGGAPCKRVRTLVAGKLAALETQLHELHLWRSKLRRALAQWDLRLSHTPRGKPARLLEVFVAAHPKSHARSSNLRPARGNRKREKQR